MSDDHEHDESNHSMGFLSFFAPPTPEEVERQELNAMSNAHAMHRFFGELKEDQIVKLIDLIKVVSASGPAAFYYIGFLSQRLDSDFGKCPACGKKHDEELAELIGDGGPTEPRTHTAKVQDNITYDHNMSLYDMEKDDDGSPRVMCKNCGKWYENLADRMLRSPGVAGCSGCIEKTKWGGGQ